LLIDMFPQTAVFRKLAQNLLTCSHVQMVSHLPHRHPFHQLKPRGVRNIDVKGGEIEGLQIPINKRFSDIGLFSRLLCRRLQCREALIFIVCGNISTALKVYS
jgi:hypothetical protein